MSSPRLEPRNNYVGARSGPQHSICARPVWRSQPRQGPSVKVATLMDQPLFWICAKGLASPHHPYVLDTASSSSPPNGIPPRTRVHPVNPPTHPLPPASFPEHPNFDQYYTKFCRGIHRKFFFGDFLGTRRALGWAGGLLFKVWVLHFQNCT